jgi:hypothetical protein
MDGLSGPSTGRPATAPSGRASRGAPGWLSSHSFTRLLAPATLLGALRHHLVAFAHALARLSARSANIRADPAGELVTFRASKHEVGVRLAELGAVQQQADVSWVRVLSAQLKAVAYRRQTYVVAAGTLVDTLLHLAHDAGGRLMWHGGTSPFKNVVTQWWCPVIVSA